MVKGKNKKMDGLIQDIIMYSFEFDRPYFDKLNKYNNLSKNRFEAIIDVDSLIFESVEKLKNLNAWYPTVYKIKRLPKNSISISGLTVEKCAFCSSFMKTSCQKVLFNPRSV